MAARRSWLLMLSMAATCSCRAELGMTVLRGPPKSATTIVASEPMTWEFYIDSRTGLVVDEIAPIFQVGFSLSPESISDPGFTIAFTARKLGAARAAIFEIDSILSHLARPIVVTIPRASFPESGEWGVTPLAIRGADGLWRQIPTETMAWSDDRLTVTTSQPFGEWAFRPSSAPVYLRVAVSNAAAAERLLYEVNLTAQTLDQDGVDIELPNDVFVQDVTGPETRFIALPDGVDGRITVNVLDQPNAQICVPEPTKILPSGKFGVVIHCRSSESGS